MTDAEKITTKVQYAVQVGCGPWTHTRHDPTDLEDAQKKLEYYEQHFPNDGPYHLIKRTIIEEVL